MVKRRIPPKRVDLCMLFLAAAIACFGGSQSAPAGPPPAPPSIPEPDFAKPAHEVVRVKDGDTVVLRMDGKDVTVRLIGVDTPESVHPSKPVQAYAKEAAAFLRNLLNRKSVFVELEPGTSTVDRYGRMLAYLFRAPDGLFVNLEIVRRGYGHTYLEYPFSYMDTFRFFEQEARTTERGLWSPVLQSTLQQVPRVSAGMKPAPGDMRERKIVFVTKTGSKYHREGCRCLGKSKIPVLLSRAKRRYQPCSICKPPK